MKIKSIEIVNIGIIEDSKIEVNKPLILLYGEVKQGKTTHLEAIKLALGSKFSDDILRHGTDRGHVFLNFDNSSIKRKFRRDKKGNVKAEKIEFVLNGEVQKKPTEAIKQFLNPFLMDQDFFTRKSELERNRFFVELFDIDTTSIDKEIKSKEEQARDLRTVIGAYGEIDVTPIEVINTVDLLKQKQDILKQYNEEKIKWSKESTDISNYNNNVRFKKRELSDLLLKIEKMKDEAVLLGLWIEENPEKPELPIIEPPDITEIDDKISEAKAQNERYDRYKENKKRYDEKQKKREILADIEQSLRDLRQDKIKVLANVADKCTVEGLKFDENANALYEDTTLGMLSMSQIMRLSSALSSLYPAGFGLELIDRGESLGKSIYGFIDKAKREEIVILATVVGEKPAKIPEDIGVWVVEKGQLK